MEEGARSVEDHAKEELMSHQIETTETSSADANQGLINVSADIVPSENKEKTTSAEASGIVTPDKSDNFSPVAPRKRAGARSISDSKSFISLSSDSLEIRTKDTSSSHATWGSHATKSHKPISGSYKSFFSPRGSSILSYSMPRSTLEKDLHIPKSTILEVILNPQKTTRMPRDGDTDKLFLLAHKAICLESHLLLAQLLSKFYQTKDRPFRGRVISLLCSWIRISPSDFETSIMIAILSLWHSLLSNGDTSDEKTWAKDIEHNKVISSQLPLIKLELNPEVVRTYGHDDVKQVTNLREQVIVENGSAIFIAMQLTALDEELFRSVDHRDLLATDWFSNPSSTLIPLRDNFNRIVLWICTEILSRTNPLLRTHLLSKFIQIGTALLELNNINGAAKVFTALSLPCVARLRETWNYLSGSDKEEWINLTLALQNQRLPTKVHEQVGCCIPSLPGVLWHFESIDKKGPLCPSIDTINIHTMNKFARIAETFKHLQRTPYAIAKDPKTQEYLRLCRYVSLDACNQLSDRHGETPEDSEFPTDEYCWYFGLLEREESEKILSACDYNCYLVRMGQNNTLFLSSKLRKDSHISHKLIHEIDGKCFLSGSTVTFHSVPHLVENCVELYGYSIAWNELARDTKQKQDLVDHFQHRQPCDIFPPNSYTGKFMSHYLRLEVNPSRTSLTEDEANQFMEGGNVTPLVTIIGRKFSADLRFKNGGTLLHVAASYNNLRFLENLMRFPSRPSVDTRDNRGMTPLHVACANGHCLFARALLDYGASSGILDNFGNTPVKLMQEFQRQHPTTEEHREMFEGTISTLQSNAVEFASPGSGATFFGNHQILYEGGDSKLSLERSISHFNKLSCQPYLEDVSIEEHQTYIGEDPKEGILQLSLSKNFLLLRTHLKDYLIRLRTSRLNISKSLDFFRPKNHFRMISTKTFSKLLIQTEEKIVPKNYLVGIFWVPSGHYGETSLLEVNAEESQNLEQFYSLLNCGRPANGDDEATITAKIGNKELAFRKLQLAPERLQQANLCSVIVVFLESDKFDLSILQKFEQDTYVVLQPQLNGEQLQYRVHVFRKASSTLHRNDFNLPFANICESSDLFRRFLLTLCVYECQRTRQLPNNAFYRRQLHLREKELFTLSSTIDNSVLFAGKSAFEKQDVNSFIFGESLGRGKTSVTYRCKEKITGAQYCIKVVNKTFMELCGEAQTEVKLLRKLDHRHIIEVYDVFHDEDKMYIVLELCTGGNVAKHVQQIGPWTENYAATVMRQILHAVTYMHSKSVSHRDIKPENVLFYDHTRTTVKMIDFGFSKDLLTQLQSNTLTGTLDYTAPEVLQSLKYDYYKIDCWSLGCMCYYLLFGVTPFAHKSTIFEVCQAALNGDFKLKTSAVHLSDDATDFIRGLMQVNPTKRFSAAEALSHKWIANNADSI
eukprot:TRINITY_DN1747_c0_g1_i1.p1 TRINITY_DN1747_c0_g1~~TRINITY_DN1747_c0_g1_i1.p1  ORF type:complete len:1418 (-),score=291.42 TRINITY_DN1747_c0_g1_i1:1995-6248(-)